MIASILHVFFLFETEVLKQVKGRNRKAVGFQSGSEAWRSYICSLHTKNNKRHSEVRKASVTRVSLIGMIMNVPYEYDRGGGL